MKSKFRALKKKIFLQVVLTVVAAAAVGVFSSFLGHRRVLQNPFAETFISLCQRILRLSPSSAKNRVLCPVPAVQAALAGGSASCCSLLVIFYFALSRVTKYFDKLSEGLDRLTDDSEEEIRLPAELDFMEKRLNAVRETPAQTGKGRQGGRAAENDLVVYLAHDIKTPADLGGRVSQPARRGPRHAAGPAGQICGYYAAEGLPAGTIGG